MGYPYPCGWGIPSRIKDLVPTSYLDPVQSADWVSQSSPGVLDSSLCITFQDPASSKAQVDLRQVQANLPFHELRVDPSFCHLPEFGGCPVSAVSPNLCSSLVLYVHAIIQVDLHCSPASSNINHQLP